MPHHGGETGKEGQVRMLSMRPILLIMTIIHLSLLIAAALLYYRAAAHSILSTWHLNIY